MPLSKDGPLCILNGYLVIIPSPPPKKIVLVSLKKDLANSADPDEMLHHAVFHLGLHCLLKDPFSGFLVYKVLNKYFQLFGFEL